jgi:hypothetical protein
MSLPPRANFAHMGDLVPQRWTLSPRENVYPFVHPMVWTLTTVQKNGWANFTPRGQSSLLGGKLHPWGSKLTPWGKIKKLSSDHLISNHASANRVAGIPGDVEALEMQLDRLMQTESKLNLPWPLARGHCVCLNCIVGLKPGQSVKVTRHCY